MCGIFGLVVANDAPLDQAEITAILRQLFLLSESRGKEAAGVAFAADDVIDVVRKAVPAAEFLRTKEYRASLATALGSARESGLGVIGHARLVTNGLQAIDANNQPVVSGDVVCVHNGIIVNDQQLWSSNPDLRRAAEVDTEVLAALVDRSLKAGDGLVEAVSTTFASITGEASVALLLAEGSHVVLATNTGSLFVVRSAQHRSAFFCSELAIARRARSRLGSDWADATTVQVEAGQGTLIDLRTAHVGAPFSLGDDPADAATTADKPSVRRVVTTAAAATEARWRALRRCSHCVLPETMPFIDFDADGVCNYCRNYRPHDLRGREALERYLDKYRSKTGDPDCLVGFSGGRDSSYGLHLLKTQYGMNPIAYTYDWGMVTDLARRNQARLCGKLGVEHIWVSADIKQKRKNIRRNVNAWLDRPDLGMVPLFMAGDKQFMWHANRLMKQTGISLMVYSTNHFERTDFKVGFCGVPPASSGVRLNKMGALSKAKLATYYLSRYARNPRYVNGSLSDTFTAFMSYYFVKQDFLYLFDYVEWDEDTINATLIGEYEWEKATDTDSTWRIGDGTAPFYNHIYRTIAGFSEYETFRSNQVREGVMGRDDALRLVLEENQTRLVSIREYCGVIGVDFDHAMRVIDAVPKHY